MQSATRAEGLRGAYSYRTARPVESWRRLQTWLAGLRWAYLVACWFAIRYALVRGAERGIYGERWAIIDVPRIPAKAG